MRERSGMRGRGVPVHVGLLSRWVLSEQHLYRFVSKCMWNGWCGVPHLLEFLRRHMRQRRMQLRKLRRGVPEHVAVRWRVLPVHGKLLSRWVLSEQYLHRSDVGRLWAQRCRMRELSGVPVGQL